MKAQAYVWYVEHFVSLLRRSRATFYEAIRKLTQHHTKIRQESQTASNGDYIFCFPGPSSLCGNLVMIKAKKPGSPPSLGMTNYSALSLPLLYTVTPAQAGVQNSKAENSILAQ